MRAVRIAAIGVVVAAIASLLDQFGFVALPTWLSSCLDALFLILGVAMFFVWFANYGNSDTVGTTATVDE